MVDFNAATPTREQLIITKLEALIRAMTDADKTPPKNGLWMNVYIGDPDDHSEWAAVNAPFCAIDQGETIVAQDWIENAKEKEVQVTIHFRFANGQFPGVDPYKVYGYYLGRLQSALLSDSRLGGVSINTREVASSPQIFTQDNLQGGFLALGIRFRTPKADPYTMR